MRILFISQYFDPEPHFKGLPFAVELKRRGYEVKVITAFPNYPGGRIYSGYRMRAWQIEKMQGIEVLRVPLYPSHNQNLLARILTYATFGISAAIASVVIGWRPDVVYAYHAPATIALPAMTVRVLLGVPFVYDINDLWPDSLVATGMVKSRFILKITELWCGLTYRAAKRIVVIAPGLKRALVERGVPEEKVSVILNWCDQAIAGGVRQEEGFEGRFVVLFAGNMGIAQGLDSVVDAAKILAVRCPRVIFLMVGSGVAESALRRRVELESVGNIRFLGRRPVSEMSSIFAVADALLVHLKDEPLFAISIPSKTQAYMLAGKPIIMAVRGDAADLVRRAQAGVCCRPSDPADLALAVEQLVAMSEGQREALGKSGRAFYLEQLALGVGVSAYEREFNLAMESQ